MELSLIRQGWRLEDENSDLVFRVDRLVYVLVEGAILFSAGIVDGFHDVIEVEMKMIVEESFSRLKVKDVFNA